MEFLSFIPTNNEVDFDRISRFQKKMLNRVASICPERAEIVTEVFRKTEGQPMVIRRAKAFEKVLEKMSIYIEDDTLIVGNQASKNFAAPIFPEYSFDWVVEELDEFEKRPGDSFEITEEAKGRLRKISTYWKDKTHKDEVLRNQSERVQLAKEQNVIHCGGISMSGDGHIIPNHELILKKGYGGLAATRLLLSH